MSVRQLRAFALAIVSGLSALPALAIDGLQATIRFEEPTQVPETAHFAPGGSGRFDVAMGYTITHLDFSRPVKSARMRSHAVLLWRQGSKPGSELTGIERALTTAWQPMPCRQSSCEMPATAPQAELYEPTGKVMLMPVMASLRAIARDASATPERRAAAQAAIQACGAKPAARGCVALQTEDEIEALAVGSPRPHTLVLMHEVD